MTRTDAQKVQAVFQELRNSLPDMPEDDLMYVAKCLVDMTKGGKWA